MSSKPDHDIPQPELHDYLVLFEAEPKVLNAKNGWCYGTEFRSARGSDSIVATVAPCNYEFSFEWLRDGQIQANLRLQGVVHWIIETKDGAERLVLKFNQSGVDVFILQLRPHISLQWATTWG